MKGHLPSLIKRVARFLIWNTVLNQGCTFRYPTVVSLARVSFLTMLWTVWISIIKELNTTGDDLLQTFTSWTCNRCINSRMKSECECHFDGASVVWYYLERHSFGLKGTDKWFLNYAPARTRVIIDWWTIVIVTTSQIGYSTS